MEDEIKKEIENYKKIVAHLNEHITEGKFDKLDVSQSKLLNKEIKRLSKKIGNGLITNNDIPLDDEIYKFSDPIAAQKKAFKYLGKNAILYRSDKPKKKYMIMDPNKNKMVHFGEIGFEDYLKHKNLTRRDNYLKRTANMKGDWKDNKYSSNNLSRILLWDGK